MLSSCHFFCYLLYWCMVRVNSVCRNKAITHQGVNSSLRKSGVVAWAEVTSAGESRNIIFGRNAPNSKIAPGQMALFKCLFFQIYLERDRNEAAKTTKDVYPEDDNINKISVRRIVERVFRHFLRPATRTPKVHQPLPFLIVEFKQISLQYGTSHA